MNKHAPLKKKEKLGRFMPIIPYLRRLKQEDCKIQDSLRQLIKTLSQNKKFKND